MLVLSRKQNERILIGQDIELVVVRISADKVRIGIDAPDGVRIMRRELIDSTRNGEAIPPACHSHEAG